MYTVDNIPFKLTCMAKIQSMVLWFITQASGFVIRTLVLLLIFEVLVPLHESLGSKDYTNA